MRLRRLTAACAVLLLISGLSACTREYTCQCEIKYSGQPGLPAPVQREYTIRDTKKKAANICEDNSSNSDAGGVHTEETCEIY